MNILLKEGTILNTNGNNILNTPFDQYQRYQTTSLIVEELRKDRESFSILEIGANEHKNLEKFLPNDIVKYLDIQLPEELKKDSQYILANATKMPEIQTNSYDILIALDVFEHIPKELRDDFLCELNRVANIAVILAGPFDEVGVNESEVRVNAYFKTKFGIDYIWLEEHISNGLPNLNNTISVLESKFNRNISHFKHGSLELWEKLIRLHFEVANNIELQSYRQNIDSYYNKNIFISDIDENCYRDFIICSSDKLDVSNFFKIKEEDNQKLNFLNDLIDSTYKLSMEKGFLNIQERDQQIQEKDQQIQEKEVQIQNLNSEIVHLHNLAQSMRMKNRIKNVIKFFIPQKIWKILKYVKNNPSSIKLGLYTLKTQGFKALINRISKVDNLSEDRILNSYTYNEPEYNDIILKQLKKFNKKPLISIIMPVYNVDPKWLELAIKSIEAQWYENWELCIADDKSTNEETIKYLKSIKNQKVKVKFLDTNLNISGSSNAALELASGEYIVLMDNDDEITPNALYEVVKVINEIDAEFIYSDEDKLEMNGTFSDPHFKPDFAPDMFLSQNYISHLGVIKKELIEKVDGFTIGLEGAQDYDLYLKVLEHTNKIFHIQKVLYHWRKIPGSTAAEFSEKSYAQNAGIEALQNAMKRRKIATNVENGKYPGTYRVKYEILDNPLVSIITPFKDMPELLKMCIESILNKSTYKNFEIIGISNNSNESTTFDEMKRLEKLDNRIKFYEYNVPFNYSDINNYAVNNYAKGKHIILLNNDIEIITPEWIENMLEHSQREEVGCVGAKLYYPNNTIQHAGISIGVLTLAGHNFKNYLREQTGYMGRESVIQNVSAVTAACLMIKTKIFKELEGLNEENLKIAFNDIDFCLRVQEKGYRNIFTPYAEAYHHESISRGAEDNPEKIARFNKEVDYMKKRHRDILEKGDPFYNPNLTLNREDFSLR
jgi:glycosyltransferase involved in cell wall biosynthesis